jgi:hypothetical protein
MWYSSSHHLERYIQYCLCSAGRSKSHATHTTLIWKIQSSYSCVQIQDASHLWWTFFSLWNDGLTKYLCLPYCSICRYYLHQWSYGQHVFFCLVAKFKVHVLFCVLIPFYIDMWQNTLTLNDNHEWLKQWNYPENIPECVVTCKDMCITATFLQSAFYVKYS